jgi:hypothetical protein
MNPLDFIVPKISFGRPAQPTQPQQPEFDPERLGPKEVYLTWEALSRPAQKFFNPKLVRTFAIIGVVVALFLVILQEYFLIILVASMLFVSQTLAKTPPELIKYEVNSYGIDIEGDIYYWHQMRRFFFYEEEGQRNLAVDLLTGFPGRLFITIRPQDEARIKEIIGQRLQFMEKPPETLLDKTYKSVAGRLNT